MTEKRILIMYNAIKNTRNMSKYWQEHPESFINGILEELLGKEKLYILKQGYIHRRIVYCFQ